MPPQVSIVIPVYNAEKYIRSSIEELIAYMDQREVSYEILLHDDKSSDHSLSVINDIDKKHRQVKVEGNTENRGLGFTLNMLFNHSIGSCIIYLDSDIPFGLEAIGVLLDKVDQADILLASRYHQISNNIPIARRITSRLYYLFCKVFFNTKVKDIGSGTVLFHRRVLSKVNFQTKGFDFHIEFYYKAEREGFSIKEVPAKIRDVSTGSFRILKHGPAIVIDTLKLWWLIQRKK